MACNSCAKPFSLLRKEKGCPSCGFSYCSKCLNDKVFLPKIKAEAKVCAKCKRLADKPDDQKSAAVQPPDAYYRRIGAMDGQQRGNISANSSVDSTDREILERLQKLKESRKETSVTTTDEDIKNRLQKIKGDVPSASDDEIKARLAKLRGVPIETLTSKPGLLPPDTRTEQEQANDLLKQYMEQTNIDTKYNEQFDGLINDMEARMNKLKGENSSAPKEHNSENTLTQDSEDEEESVKKIIEKMKAEASLEHDEFPPSTNDELPFCEICNEDATMRCLGCKYLFCKACFMEHKDDDDGCNRYRTHRGHRASRLD